MTKTAVTHVSPGRPKDIAKRAAILSVARTMFFARGLEAVTIEAVAAAAQVSRMTVYGHFEDKEALFAAMITVEADRLVQSLSGLSPWLVTAETATSSPLRADLINFGTGLLVFFLSPDVKAFQRLLEKEGPRHPELVRAFVNRGPRAVSQKLRERLQAAMSVGEIVIDDPRQAAQMLIGLFRSIETPVSQYGLSPPPTRARIERHVTACVSLFLKAHAVGLEAR